MIKAYRLYNLLMSGALTAEELDTLLERRDYLGAMYALRGHEFRMHDLANSPLAIDVLCRSDRAVRALAENAAYLDYLFCADAAYEGMLFSDLALREEAVRTRVTEYMAGLPWKAKAHSVAAASFQDICHSPELGIYVGVGNGIVGASEDRVNWEVFTISGSYTGVCWSSQKNQFLAVGNSGVLAKSYDGREWTTTNVSMYSFNKLYWVPRHALYVSVAGSYIHTSGDGEDWTQRATYNTNFLVDDGTQYIGGGTASTNYQIYVSGDCRSWSQSNVTLPKSGRMYGGIWLKERNRLVLVGDLVLLRDGATWKAVELPNGVSLREVVYSPRLNMLAATGPNVACTSMDFGDTWSISPSPSRTSPVYEAACLEWDDTRRVFIGTDKNSAECLTSHEWRRAA
jgi:hypothetical protein